MASETRQILSRTESLCPRCLRRIPAITVASGNEVFLEKQCEKHGHYSAVIWRGQPAFKTWVRPKIPTEPRFCHAQVENGCPFDCGLCAEHRQHTCTAVLEVTNQCDLHCRVCFADSGRSGESDPDLGAIARWYQLIIAANGRTCNIQLSGGEPTLRKDLPSIIELGTKLGFSFIQLNTNGRRLSRNRNYVNVLKEAGLRSIFLQFDGTEDRIYRYLRGRPLLKEKRTAIERCYDEGVGVVLVPTLVPGVNVHNIGAILEFAKAMAPAVRGVHFQPISYFGRYPNQPEDALRITLPEVMLEMEKQTAEMVKATDFCPSGCEHSLCSFHGNFVVMPDGQLIPLTEARLGACCEKPENAKDGARQTVAVVAKQWSASPEGAKAGTKQGPSGGQNARNSGAYMGELDSFWERLQTHTLSISGMAFQDVWTLDMERLRDCCIHIVGQQRGLVPFCAYNLTSLEGRSLYRGR